MKSILFSLAGLLSLSSISHADVIKCSSTHLGRPDDLVVYIQRDKGVGSDNMVLARSSATGESPLIIAHFRGDNGETGFDADNGIQLLVAGQPEKREEADGASPRRVFLGKKFDQIQDLHVYWPANLQTAESFSTQIRADMKKLESSAEPRANTLQCSVVQAGNFANPEGLHEYAKRDLDIRN